MGKTILEMSVSLDGYVAGPGVSANNPLGDGGEQLHEWMLAGRSESEHHQFETDYFSTIGALVMGRRMVDVGIGPRGENPTFHAPVFVLTHRPHRTIQKQGGTSYAFVTDGPESALEQARTAAGDRDVLVNGGAATARQYLDAGHLDEIRLNLVPVVLGAGTPLFTGLRSGLRLTPASASVNGTTVHLSYRRAT